MLIPGITSAQETQTPASDTPQSPSTTEKAPPAVTPEEPVTKGLTAADAKALWEKLQQDSSIDDAVKESIQPKFDEAIADLELAATFHASAERFRGSLEAAPKEAEVKRQETSKLPTPEDAARVSKEFESAVDIQRELAAVKANLESLQDELDKVTTSLDSVRETRPSVVSTRQPEAQGELEIVRVELQNPDLSDQASAPGRIADRTLLQALEAKLTAELEMLKQEKTSTAAREELLEARSDSLTRQVENSASLVKELQAREQAELKREAQKAESVVTETKDLISKDDLQAQALVKEVTELKEKFERVAGYSSQMEEAQGDVANRLKRLNEEYQRLSKEFEVDGIGAAMVQVAFQLQERILDPNIYAVPRTTNLPSADSVRLDSIRTDQQLRDHGEVEKKFASRKSESIAKLLQTRFELLEKLKAQYKLLLPAAITFQANQHELERRITEIEGAISEKLIWLRSSPTIGVRDLVSLPSGIKWWFSEEHWGEFCTGISNAFSTDPIRFTLFLFVIIALLGMRPRLIGWLTDTGPKIRRISTDRYALSVEALTWTLLLAAPTAIILSFLGWTMTYADAPSAWLQSLAGGTATIARIAFVISFTSEICRPKGLGNTHFGWNQTTLKAIRKTVFRFGVVYIPAGLIACSTLYGETSSYGDGIGRISMMVAKLWIWFLLWQQFGGKQGLVAKLKKNQPNRLLTRTRLFWYPLLLCSPLFFFVLAARGYVIASINLSHGFAETIGVIVLGDVIYWMVLRWFSLQAKKLAVANRMERLIAARDAAEAAGETDEDLENEAITVPMEEDESLDLETISQQTRSLVRSLIGIGIVITIASLWSSSLPIAQQLRDYQVPLTDFDLLEIAKGFLVFGITWLLIKNLPGVLELSVLRAYSIESGTKYAIVSLCRYAIGAIGLMVITNVLNFDFTQFGWMAAALSVGLGFGLQEVITNFVCGLILLFERPVRIGDVVTIQGTTGTVTKIRMRATTITNWDRQEFVVPNKSLITDTILNWTLSASISRIVINVGVAYGTDTDQAREILLEVANDHPVIMQDPAPMATFEQFADSTLNLVLRCYVPDLGFRLRTTSELHTAVNHRFNQAGIEIAFPQQDIHIRSGIELLARSNTDNRAAS
ncbi:mechanosensitive ion channel [bacterium]|nr:mechanosensitive ion channel [bacterium]